MHILLVRNCNPKVQPTENPEPTIAALARALRKRGHKVSCLAKGGNACSDAEVLHYNKSRPLHEQIPADVELVHFHCTNDEEIAQPSVTTLYENNTEKGIYAPNTVFVSAAQARMHGSSFFIPPGLDWDTYEGPLLIGQHRSYCHFLGDASWPERNLRSAVDVAGKAGVRLHVIGGSRISLKRRWRFLLNTNLRFHGPLHHEGRQALLNQSQALIHPIRWAEPFSLAAIESLYFGCPVIGTPMGVLPELINPQVPVRNIEEEWSGAVDAIYSDLGCLSMKTSDMVEAVRNVSAFDPKVCHEFAAEHFSADRMAKAYLEVYERVLKGQALQPATLTGVNQHKKAALPVLEP